MAEAPLYSAVSRSPSYKIAWSRWRRRPGTAARLNHYCCIGIDWLIWAGPIWIVVFKCHTDGWLYGRALQGIVDWGRARWNMARAAMLAQHALT